jgi:cell division protein FtsW
MSLTRADDSRAAEWWFTIDRKLLTAFLILSGAGVLFSLAGSPAIALKKGLPAFHFVERQVVYALVGAVLMLALSILEPRQIRRIAVLLLAIALVGLATVLVLGPEVNGSRRWLRVGSLSLQPSELAKPTFVVVSAWLFAEARARAEVPALAISAVLCGGLVALLLAQPDVGQTVLITLVWGALFFLSGQPILRAGLLGFGLLSVVGIAGLTFDHTRQRIWRFLVPSSGDTYQTDRALQSFTEGGLLGRGPGEGIIKLVLPDAHTDFIFGVIGEEFGALVCLALVGLYAFVLWRAALRSRAEPDAANRLGIIGLALLLTLQAVINMGVNVGLLPAKGMTLPFISAGGSSTLSVAVTAGMLLALMRRRTDAAHVAMPQLGPSLGAVRPGAHGETRW